MHEDEDRQALRGNKRRLSLRERFSFAQRKTTLPVTYFCAFPKGIDLSGPANRVSAAFIHWAAALFFGFVTLMPILRRLRHPTILGDDITRIVDVVKYPFREHLFLPFAEHIAPLFQLVTWLTWEAIGRDVRLAPLGYSAASVLSWVLVLGLFGYWLWRETGSRTAALVAVALAAQSPLVLETAWWYSASSFLWAIAGILIAILGASFLARRPVMALLAVGIGSGIGLAGTTLGILAGPLAIVRGLVDRRASRWVKALVIVAAVGGVFTYRQVCKVGGVTVFHSDPRSALPSVDPRGGLYYALTVPGRVLWPSLVGVPVSREIMPQPLWLSIGAGAVVLALTAVLAFWPRAPWNRRQVLVGAAMIYGCYILTYSARAHMLKTGQWTEPQFLYQFASRYHVLPLLGSVTILATLLASWPFIRRVDARRGAPALLAAVVGLATMFVQEKESSFWNWMLDQPDQKTTLAAVHHVGDLARDQHVTRAQLMRIFDPVRRPWNGSVMNDRPYAFHLMNLAVQAPEKALRPVPDEEARTRLLASLSPEERIALGSGTCAFHVPEHLEPTARTLALGRRVLARHVAEYAQGKYRPTSWPAYLEYEFDSVPEARYLVFPGLAADQDVVVFFSETAGLWRHGQNVRWIKSPRADATIDLGRLIHRPGGPVARIRLEFTCPGELALEGPPRLLR